MADPKTSVTVAEQAELRAREAAEPTQVMIETGQASQHSMPVRNLDEELTDVDARSSYSISVRLWHCLLCKSSDKHKNPSWHARDVHKKELMERGEYSIDTYLDRYFV